MKQHSRSLEMMSVLVIVITGLLFFLLISLATNFYRHIGDINYFKINPGAVMRTFCFFR